MPDAYLRTLEAAKRTSHSVSTYSPWLSRITPYPDDRQMRYAKHAMAKMNNFTIELPETPPANIPKPEIKYIARNWLFKFARLLDEGLSLSEVIHEDSWWRDMLSLTWEFSTIRGRACIDEFVSLNQPRARVSNIGFHENAPGSPEIEHPQKGLMWLRSIFSFSSSHGYGKGVVYLTQSKPNGPWRAYCIYTSLQELLGYPECTGPTRPVSTSTQSQRGDTDGQVPILIIGAGQSGLNVGAQFQTRGLPYLIVEKHGNVGDNWRHRYKTLVTHDHVDTTHLAYFKFPENWPRYSSKDELADWLEAYAKAMKLNIWLQTEVVAATYDDMTKQWTVGLLRNQTTCTLHPRHIVWCAGHFSSENVPVLRSHSRFAGIAYHAAKHTDASINDPNGKRVIIIGSGNSAHDIAEDYYNNGANVTIIQRGSTYVLGQNGMDMLPENALIETSMPLPTRDLLSESLPWPVALQLCVELTREITAADRKTIDGLKRVGFQINFGTDGQGILERFIQRGGAYYIDFGCSQLLIEGKIKVRHCPTGIEGFDERHLLFTDGSKVQADIVVFATGYKGMKESIRRLLGDSVAERCNDIWGLDEEGEVRGIWRPSGHPGLWIMGGNLAQSRVYSKFLALQVIAREAGMV